MSNITQIIEEHAIEKILEYMVNHLVSTEYIQGMIYMHMQMSQNLRFLQIFCELRDVLSTISWRVEE